MYVRFFISVGWYFQSVVINWLAWQVLCCVNVNEKVRNWCVAIAWVCCYQDQMWNLFLWNRCNWPFQKIMILISLLSWRKKNRNRIKKTLFFLFHNPNSLTYRIQLHAQKIVTRVGNQLQNCPLIFWWIANRKHSHFLALVLAVQATDWMPASGWKWVYFIARFYVIEMLIKYTWEKKKKTMQNSP